jgi:hypothetical protein
MYSQNNKKQNTIIVIAKMPLMAGLLYVYKFISFRQIPKQHALDLEQALDGSIIVSKKNGTNKLDPRH